jgi:hypothetical protein
MELSYAIKLLKPDSEFSYNNEDYSTVKWVKLDGDAPTQSEIDDAIEQVKANEAAAIAKAATNKAAAQTKLAALGLTTDELNAIGL